MTLRTSDSSLVTTRPPYQAVDLLDYELAVPTEHSRAYHTLGQAHVASPTSHAVFGMFSFLWSTLRDLFFFVSRDRTVVVHGRPNTRLADSTIEHWSRVHAHAYFICLTDTPPVTTHEVFRLATRLWNPSGRAELLRLCYPPRSYRNLWVHQGHSYLEWDTHNIEQIFDELSRSYGSEYRQRVETGLLSATAGETASSPSASERLLEVYGGRVERIDGPLAYVEMRDQLGRVSHAQLSTDYLAASGISDRDRFSCEIRRKGDETVLRFRRALAERLSDEQLSHINQRLDRELPDSILPSND